MQEVHQERASYFGEKMPKKKLGVVLAVGLTISLFMGIITMAWSMGTRDKSTVPRISKEEVKDMRGTP